MVPFNPSFVALLLERLAQSISIIEYNKLVPGDVEVLLRHGKSSGYFLLMLIV